MSGIPFPKMHIAESALNRIMNALEGQGSPFGLTPMTPPLTADPLMQGAALDAQLEQEPGEVAVPPTLQEEASAGALEESVAGGSPLAGMIGGTGFAAL